ncbi:MAG: cupin domain-containing protein [Candidatus Jettenia sp. AMX1]|nr:cupin domain-containing protein [Candidatus Jettenia sp. AMX1]
MEPIHLEEKIKFNKEHFIPNILYASPKVKMPLICMEPGQEIPSHGGHSVGIFYVKEGKGIFTLDNQKIDMEKGGTNGCFSYECGVKEWEKLM